MTALERRASGTLHLRNGAGLRFSGYGALFNVPADLGVFREMVAPGAFAASLSGTPDIRLLVNHDTASVIGRTTAGNLRLREDTTGLKVEADLDPDDLDVRRLAPKLRSRLVSQMSFGFSVGPGGDVWDNGHGDERPMRTLTKVRLFETSIVTFPAYDQTSATLG